MIYGACSKEGSVIASTILKQEIFEKEKEIQAGPFRTDKAKLYKNGKLVKPSKASLESLVMNLARYKPTQFGISTRKAYQIVCSPNVALSFPPEDYKKRGAIDQKRLEAYNSFYNEIQAFARLRNKKQLRKSIDRLLQYDHGALRRFFAPKNYSIQEVLDRELLDKNVKSAILVLRSRKDIHKQAYTFEHETGCRAWPLQNFPYVAIRGSTKDIRKVLTYTGKGLFSRFASKVPYLIREASLCHGIYVPELITEFFTGKKVIPIKSKKVLWNLENIGAPAANQTTDGRGARVAVVDSGVDYRHYELTSCFTENKGYDFVEGIDPMDKHYHGTHVAGTIAGMTTGVAPGCTLYALRVLDDKGRGTLDNVLRAVDWGITHQIDIANFSLGSPTGAKIEEMVFEKAAKAGLVCIAAAGNEGIGPNYPASYGSVIAVAAVDQDNKHAEFSNIYHTNRISAPGVRVFSTLPRNEFGLLSGTSMASPHVGGCAALVASQKNINIEAYDKMLEKTADPLGEAEKFGYGLVRADKQVVMKRWLAA